MSFSLSSALIVFSTAAVAAQFYTLSGYACSQPVLYAQCQCPSFCGSYGSGDYSNYGGFPDYKTWSKQHPHKRRRTHKKKKFRFETLEENGSEELVSPPAVPSESSSRVSSHTWEDEDLWASKFENSKSKPSTKEGASEELPEISSAEIAAARDRHRGRTEESEGESSQVPSSHPDTSRMSTGPGRGGVGIGGGVGAGPVGVGTGLGIGAPGIGGLGGQGGGGGLGGLGLGNGGLFGISSGVGVGVPGVGPIGISSGLGIGR